jgi:predicted permease
MIINEAMARQVFGDENPLGKRIRSWRDENQLREVVGVVQDVRYFGRDDSLQALVFVPHRQDTWNTMAITVRAANDPANLASAIRSEVSFIDKNVAVANLQTMERILSDSVAERRLNTMLLSIFAAVALILAAVGIYGILSYSVAQRTHEIGIRMALGARTTNVMSLIVGQGIKVVLVGVIIGIAGALALSQLLATLLYEVSATDPLTFVLIPLVLIGVALVASFIPARRAMKVDPMIALRHE